MGHGVHGDVLRIISNASLNLQTNGLTSVFEEGMAVSPLAVVQLDYCEYSGWVSSACKPYASIGHLWIYKST